MTRMNLMTQAIAVQEFFKACLSVMQSRQHDYAPDGIALLEAAKGAAISNVTLEQYLHGLFNKQLSAYYRYVYTGQLDSDSIHSRLRDAANYLALTEYYIRYREELHQAWQAHFEPVKCQCGNPTVAIYGPSSDWCLRCCVLKWSVHHSNVYERKSLPTTPKVPD